MSQTNSENDRQDFNEDIRNALDTLKKGGVILYPTDTIWGLGCDATNPEAIKKIFEIKRRQAQKSMILLVDSIATAERFTENIPEAAEQLIDVAVQPLTIIYDHGRNVAHNAMAKDGTVAIRITGERFTNTLCKRLRVPLVSTSANVSGNPAPTNFSEIPEEIIQAADYVVKFRQNDMSHPQASNIIKVSDSNEIKIIR